MSEPDEILALAFRRVSRDVDLMREDNVMDDDWIDQVEARVHDLFRDLVVVAGLADRAVDWAGDGQSDPLREIDSPPPTRLKRRELRQALLDLDCRGDCSPEDLCMSEDADDAIDRGRRLLRLLHRFIKGEDDLDELQYKAEQLLDMET